MIHVISIIPFHSLISQFHAQVMRKRGWIPFVRWGEEFFCQDYWENAAIDFRVWTSAIHPQTFLSSWTTPSAMQMAPFGTFPLQTFWSCGRLQLFTCKLKEINRLQNTKNKKGFFSIKIPLAVERFLLGPCSCAKPQGKLLTAPNEWPCRDESCHFMLKSSLKYEVTHHMAPWLGLKEEANDISSFLLIRWQSSVTRHMWRNTFISHFESGLTLTANHNVLTRFFLETSLTNSPSLLSTSWPLLTSEQFSTFVCKV